MKNISFPLRDDWFTSPARQVTSRVVISANMNNVYATDVVTTDSIDEELFPKGSPIELMRAPSGGIFPKVIMNESVFTSTDSPNPYRLSSESDRYKYYISDKEFYQGFNQWSYVVKYSEPVPINKVRAVFETGNTQVSQCTLSVLPVGSTGWSSFSVAVGGDGIAEMNHSDLIGWLSDDPAETKMVEQIRVTASPASGWQRIALVQLAGIAEISVSPSHIASLSVSTSAGESGPLNVMGQALAGTLSLSLNNEGGYFDSVVDYLSINNRVEVLTTVATQGNSQEFTHGVYYVDSWSRAQYNELSASGTDISKFMQQWEPPRFFTAGSKETSVVVELLQRAGIDASGITRGLGKTLSLFYSDGTGTIWERLNEIAQSCHSWFWIDGDGRMRWQPIADSWTNPMDATFREATSGANLSMINSYSMGVNANINLAKVFWTAASDNPERELWEEQETLVLSSAALLADVPTTATTIKIYGNDWDVFSDEGVVSINHEIIRYKKSETRGLLTIKDRGIYGTSKAHHRHGGANTTIPGTILRYNDYSALSPGIEQDVSGTSPLDVYKGRLYWGSVDSLAKLQPRRSGNTSRDMLQVMRTDYTDYALIGAKFHIDSTTSSDGTPVMVGAPYCGIFIKTNNTKGVFFELQPKLMREGSTLVVYRYLNGTTRTNLYTGNPIDVLAGKDYTMEVARVGSNSYVVLINGTRVTPQINVGSIGVGYHGAFIRGFGTLKIDHIYGIDSPKVSGSLGVDQVVSAHDYINGGVRSVTEPNLMFDKANEISFEDFGPVVREGKEYEVTYSAPSSTGGELFISDENDVWVPHFKSSQFDAEFAILNASTTDTVVVGQDPATESDMSLFIHGKPVKNDEDDKNFVEVKDEVAIRQYGEQEIELRPRWVSTKSMAQSLADTIVGNWAKDQDTVELEIVATPFLETGDNIQVDLISGDSHPWRVTSTNYSISSSGPTMGVTATRIA